MQVGVLPQISDQALRILLGNQHYRTENENSRWRNWKNVSFFLFSQGMKPKLLESETIKVG